MSGILWAACLAAAWAQSTIHLPTQGRAADFSGYPQTKPARVVAALPAGCTAGEAVIVTGGPAAGLYVCNGAGAWVAAAPHGHQLSELSGVAGKQGTGTLLQAFGGGPAQAGECAEFDSNGNLVSARKPCGGTPNFSLSFTGQTTVLLEHGLGTRNVLAGCVDSNDRLVIPDRIQVLDNNRVQVNFVTPQSGRCVVNANGGGGSGSAAVSSVFGRTGAVTAQAGDYSFSQIAGFLALNQIAPAALQGNGSKIQLFSGTAAANDCAKFDANGNLVSAGAPCGTGSGAVSSVFGRTGAVTAQAGDYTFSQIAGFLALNQIAPAALQGNGSKIQLFSGTAAANDCAKFDANGNLVSAGAACGTGNGDVTGPAGAVDGEVAVFQGSTGKTLRRATGSGLVRLANGVLGFVTGAPSDCVRADGSTGPCGGTIYFGAGLEGSGTPSDPVRLATGGSVASQTFYSASLTFGSIPAFTCQEQPIPAPGVSAGESVAAGLPGALPAGILGTMYGAADAVVVRLCNVTGAAVAVPDGMSYNARVVRGF
ncbi:MAG: hypothetical protein N2036_12675 [Bryobacteraceae bacterium]|nr:hypothetical protein [Bryobacteraceae bacterium]MCX7604923.1 hypothetical protein [Bryobacteraceae bacterium]